MFVILTRRLLRKIFSVAPEIINPMRIALQEQKQYLETSLLNVSGSGAASPALACIVKRQQEEHIDYLIKQGKIDVAIEQVSITLWNCDRKQIFQFFINCLANFRRYRQRI